MSHGYLVLRETPSDTARFCTEADVRFSFLAIFSRPSFLRASDLSSRTSAVVHGARCIVGAFAIMEIPSSQRRSSTNFTIRTYRSGPGEEGRSVAQAEIRGRGKISAELESPSAPE
jgi:hypothetical protein